MPEEAAPAPFDLFLMQVQKEGRQFRIATLG
jgi:hypothetical protein